MDRFGLLESARMPRPDGQSDEGCNRGAAAPGGEIPRADERPTDPSAVGEAPTSPLGWETTGGGTGAAEEGEGQGESPPAPVIGGYRLLRELGRGGMGVVYLADREGDRVHHLVALKLLKRGMDTDEILRRFELERQVLAALDHPGIAHLFDAGETEDGLPYYVMEYVDGLPIGAHCDANRLSIEDRLRLFRKVCAAVHHAHRNLVIHRDLKPGNILVSADGQPKLLDFGIAKLLGPDLSPWARDPTAPQFRVMTPEYASPEQVRGLPLTTASDVYSLGVVLYQLLSGRSPYQLESRTPADIARVVCTEDPDRPSTALTRVDDASTGTAEPGAGGAGDTTTAETASRARGGRPQRIRRRLSGDLDNIVFKAMRKEPQRRYASAEQLSEDIQRHLDGLPVTARPDTLTYRVTKFVRRHRAEVAGAAMITLLLVGSIGSSAWSWQVAEDERAVSARAREQALVQARIAARERDRAAHRFDQVRALATTFMVDFHDAIRELDGALPARRMLVEKALEYLDGLVADAGADRDLTRDLARGYLRIGDIRGGVRTESLGDIAGALESYQRSLDLRRGLAAGDPLDAVGQRELSAAHLKIAELLRTSGDVGRALDEGQAALAIRERLLEESPMDVEARRDLAVALGHVGAALIANGEPDKARGAYDRSLSLREALAAEQPGVLRAQRDLATMCLRVGGRFASVGEWAQTRDLYERAVEIRRGVAEKSPSSGRHRRDLAMASLLLGDVLLELSELTDAAARFRTCLAICEQRARDNPQSARATRDLAIAHEAVGRMLATRGEWDEALPHFRSMQRLIVPLAQADPPGTFNRRLLAISHERHGDAHAAAGNHAAAVDAVLEGLAIIEDLARRDEADVRPDPDVARMLTRLGAWLRDDGRPDEARRRLDAARSLFGALHTAQPLDPSAATGLAEALHELSRLEATVGNGATALTLAAEAVATSPRPTARMLRDLARARHLTGDDDGAYETAVEAMRRLEAEPAPAEDLRRLLGHDLRAYRARMKRAGQGDGK